MSSVVIVFKGNTLFSNADTLLAICFWEGDRGAACARPKFPTLSCVPQLSGIELLCKHPTDIHSVGKAAVWGRALSESNASPRAAKLFLKDALLPNFIHGSAETPASHCLNYVLPPCTKLSIGLDHTITGGPVVHCLGKCGSSGGVRPHQGISEACGTLKEQYVISPGWLHTAFN